MKNLSKNTGHVGMTTISTANSNLDGTGTLGTVITATEEMHIGLILIKATGDTTQGVVRLFIEDASSNKTLIEEVTIPGNDQTSVLPAFQEELFLNLYLPKNYKILASTENAESFNVIAAGHYWTYASSEEQIVESAVSGIATVSTANSNLNGTGTMSTVISGGNNGSYLTEIDIKATGDTAQGMVRLFLHDGTNTKLYKEEIVPAITQDSVTPAYHRVSLLDLALPNNWSLRASTQVADTFKMIVTGKTWQYTSLPT